MLFRSHDLVSNKIMVYLKEHGQLPVKIKKSDGWLIRFSLKMLLKGSFFYWIFGCMSHLVVSYDISQDITLKCVSPFLTFSTSNKFSL